MKKLIFDGSFDGFLTTIFVIYENKWRAGIDIVSQADYMPSFFDDEVFVTTDTSKSDRVWTKIKTLFGDDSRLILWAFLSEMPHIYSDLYQIICQKIDKPTVNIINHYTQSSVFELHRAVKMVGRERHRMQAFVRFEHTIQDVYVASIYPDFNVLPLIVKFFAKRFADQSWLIFDIKRGFGVHYDKVTKRLSDVVQIDDFNKTYHSKHESHYQKLWQTYFKSVTIAERKNIKHHIQQMPKRYWRYLTEKQAL